MKYKTLELKCDTCGKTIKGQAEVYYDYTIDQDRKVIMELLCVSCFKKWEQSWEIKELEVTDTIPHLGKTNYIVTFIDGRKEHGYYCTIGGRRTNFEDAPEELDDRILEYIQKWREKQQSAEEQQRQQRRISDIHFNDNQDIPTLDFVTFGSLQMTNVKYRVTAKGEILVDRTVGVPEFVLEQIPEHWERFKGMA